MYTKIWAHRGSSHTYIENSLAAFNQAIEDGADGIELDVHRTADGELIVFHDTNLKRLTGKDQMVWEAKWSDIEKLTLTDDNIESEELSSFYTGIPKLEEVLELINKTDLLVNIELKNGLNFYPGLEEEVIKSVNKYSMKSRVLYSSFNHVSMNKISSLIGAEHSAILTGNIEYQPWNYMENMNVSTYHPSTNSLRQQNLVKNIHDKNLKINFWTANREEHINIALLLGANGIITDDPKKAVELRKKYKNDNGKKASKDAKKLGIHIIK